MIPALILLALVPGASAEESRVDRVEVAQVIFHQRIIIRIPRLPFTHPPVEASQPVRWVEKKGPKCVALGEIAGATITAANSVDLIVEDDKRIRAKLDDDCPSLDYYSGLYLKATPDGMICADRDAVRTRSGGSCGIDEFKRLVAKH
ncbi:hypothetical protein ABC974_05575 [Sphingomonas oligophenolica]|uniref:DUF3617 family protein n=1 Tax=Sphingomonas oligophenolica TaxID=301154 RepID=A0ABU9XZV0_9SPHN